MSDNANLSKELDELKELKNRVESNPHSWIVDSERLLQFFTEKIASLEAHIDRSTEHVAA